MASSADIAFPGETPIEDHGGYPPLKRAIYALVLLIFVYLLYFADAQLISLLVTPIEQAYGINDTRFSLLSAAPTIIAILVMGLPMASLVDRWNRRNLLAAALIFWTIMNVLCAFAPGFWILFALKVGVAIGGVWYYPTVVSMLSDLFPPKHRTLAFTALHLCGTSGIGLAVLFSGGAVALSHRLADTGSTIPWWQWSFILVSVPAPIGAILLFTIKEPIRHLTTAAQREPVKLLTFLKRNWGVCAAVILGTSIAGIPIYAARSWLPEYFVRAFDQQPTEASTLTGLILTFSTAIGIGLGGLAAVWLRRRGQENASLAVVITSYITPVALFALLPVMHGPQSAALLFGTAFFLFNLHGGPQIEIIQGVVPNEIRGRFVTLVLMFSVFGIFLGPVIVGLLNDHVFHGRQGIIYSLTITTAVASILAACCWSYRTRSTLALLRGELHA